ncbi:uncharacterized protein [Miscanthus floridulus]|uniref:uncharacterized protein isoform X2 n=1 Tax=Miscanthus floridulus TaxID=154761 RepID=UPI00345B43C8
MPPPPPRQFLLFRSLLLLSHGASAEEPPAQRGSSAGGPHRGFSGAGVPGTASRPRVALTRAAVPVAGSAVDVPSATTTAPARAGLRRGCPGDERGRGASALRRRPHQPFSAFLRTLSPSMLEYRCWPPTLAAGPCFDLPMPIVSFLKGGPGASGLTACDRKVPGSSRGLLALHRRGCRWTSAAGPFCYSLWRWRPHRRGNVVWTNWMILLRKGQRTRSLHRLGREDLSLDFCSSFRRGTKGKTNVVYNSLDASRSTRSN